MKLQELAQKYEDQPVWAVVKLEKGKPEVVLHEGLTFEHAHHLGEHHMVGLLEGQEIRVRADVPLTED